MTDSIPQLLFVGDVVCLHAGSIPRPNCNALSFCQAADTCASWSSVACVHSCMSSAAFHGIPAAVLPGMKLLISMLCHAIPLVRFLYPSSASQCWALIASTEGCKQAMCQWDRLMAGVEPVRILGTTPLHLHRACERLFFAHSIDAGNTGLAYRAIFLRGHTLKARSFDAFWRTDFKDYGSHFKFMFKKTGDLSAGLGPMMSCPIIIMYVTPIGELEAPGTELEGLAGRKRQCGGDSTTFGPAEKDGDVVLVGTRPRSLAENATCGGRRFGTIDDHHLEGLLCLYHDPLFAMCVTVQ